MRLNHIVAVLAIVACLSLSSSAMATGTEACCSDDNTCQMLTSFDCEYFGVGTSQGPGSTCGGIQACCDSVTGACYAADRTCCLANGDVPLGPGSVCSAPDACCLSDNTCQMLDAICCLFTGGTPQGAGSTCDSNPCLSNGACCDPAQGLCVNDVASGDCEIPLEFHAGQDCLDVACILIPPVPTVSEWSLIIMTVLAFTAGTILFGRRRRAAAV